MDAGPGASTDAGAPTASGTPVTDPARGADPQRRRLLQAAGAAAWSAGAAAASGTGVTAASLESPPDAAVGAGHPPPDDPSPRRTDTRPGDPPLRTGLQGQTDAASASAHRLRDGDTRWRVGVVERDAEVEDLVVVGAGLSGLAGAWLYRAHAGRPVRILLLDAMDDLGGHARRNEFTARNGERLVGHGGSQSLDTPSFFSPLVRSLLSGLGLALERFPGEIYDAGWRARHRLQQQSAWFPQAAWGRDTLVLHDPDEPAARWLSRSPFSPGAQAALLRLWADREDVWPGMPRAARLDRLAEISYARFLREHWQIPPEALRWHARSTHGYFGVGIDAVCALDAHAAGLPGFAAMRLALAERPDPRLSPSARLLLRSPDEYVYHFPDGNAGLARALVRDLLPDAGPAGGDDAMAALADGRLDYGALDRAGASVRLRLRSAVVGLRHLGPPDRADTVELRYVDAGGTLRAVRARQVLLACWHRVIPKLTDELPPAQVRALDDQVRVPLLYANALLSNWQAWQRAGTASLRIVDGFWDEASLDMPTRLGRQHPSPSADRPILVHLAKVITGTPGRAPRTQAAQGRARLAGWSEARLEQEVRTLLEAALGPHGFDVARDLEAITVNRWAHGYSLEYARPWDRGWPHGPLPCEQARQGWGRVAIANADAGAYAYAHGAIDQAGRAVQALLPHARLPSGSAMPGPPAAAMSARG